MANAFLVQVIDTLQQLFHDVDDSGLLNDGPFHELLSHPLAHRSMVDVFHYDVNSLLVLQHLKYSSYLRMVDEHESCKLILLQNLHDLRPLLDLIQPDTLYASHHFSLLMNGFVDR